MDVQCHEFFECTKKECIMFEDGEERNCWDVKPILTHCNFIFTESIEMKNKIVFCRNCSFYKHVNKNPHDKFSFKVSHQ